MRRVAKLTL